jgi:hypothetical protein
VAKKTTDDSIAEHADEASQSVIGGLDELNRRLTEHVQPFTAELRAFLNGLEGRSFGLAANKAILAAIQGLLQRLGLRVCCPYCGEPAILRCRPHSYAKGGAFGFGHSQATHGGWITFPALKLVPAPPNRG